MTLLIIIAVLSVAFGLISFFALCIVAGGAALRNMELEAQITRLSSANRQPLWKTPEDMASDLATDLAEGRTYYTSKPPGWFGMHES